MSSSLGVFARGGIWNDTPERGDLLSPGDLNAGVPRRTARVYDLNPLPRGAGRSFLASETRDVVDLREGWTIAGSDVVGCMFRD